MRRSKKLLILLCILALTSIATFAVREYEEHKEKIRNSEEIIIEIPKDTVKSLSWKYDSEHLSFHKDEKWFYDGDLDFPVDLEKIDKLLKWFESLKASFIIEDVKDYGQYGLDEPTCIIKLATDEKSYEILVGNYSIMDSQRYISIGDGKVYLVKDDPMELFEISLSELINHDEIPIFSNNVTKIQFKGNENYSIVYEEGSQNSYNENDVYFAYMNGRKVPLDTTRVNSYLSKISSLNLTNYVTYNATDVELKKYGLDEPELTITIDYKVKNKKDNSSDTIVLNISHDPNEKKLTDDKTKDEKITAYARIGSSPIIYNISPEKYKDLMAASYDSFRHLELFYGNFNDIIRIDFELEGNNYTIRSDKKGDKRYYYYNDEEIDILNLQTALRSLKAEKFTDEKAIKKKEISLIIHLDNPNFPEIKIDLYRYDGSYCLAVVNGEPLSLVKRSNVVDLIETVYAIVLNN